MEKEEGGGERDDLDLRSESASRPSRRERLPRVRRGRTDGFKDWTDVSSGHHVPSVHLFLLLSMVFVRGRWIQNLNARVWAVG